MTIRISFIKNLLNRNYTKTISKLDIVTALNKLIYLILQNKARFILDRFHIFITISLFFARLLVSQCSSELPPYEQGFVPQLHKRYIDDVIGVA